MIMPSTAARSRLGEREDVAEQDAPLVGGLLTDGAKAPTAHEAASIESADRDVGIPGVEGEKHSFMRGGLRRRGS